MPVDRHHGHGTKYGTRYTFGIVKSASIKIDKLRMLQVRSFEYRKRCIFNDGLTLTETWPQHKNADSTVGVGQTDSVPDAEVRTATGVLPY